MELVIFGEVWNSDGKILRASDAMVCCCFMLTVEQMSVTFYFVQSDWYRGWACVTNGEDFLCVNCILGAFGKLRKAKRLLASSCLSILEFPKEYYIWIWEQQDWEVDQEIDGKMGWERMEE